MLEHLRSRCTGRGRGGGGEEGGKWGERGQVKERIRIRNTMTRGSVTGADRYCGIQWDADAVGSRNLASVSRRAVGRETHLRVVRKIPLTTK